MANLQETAQWEIGVYQIEETDPVQGGPNGIDNLPHRHLANRTAILKQVQDALNSEITTARGTFANLNARLNTLVTQTIQGENTYAGTNGKTISHVLGHTNYIVNTVPIQNTGGDLGDVFVSRASNAFTIFNTGGFTGSFRFQIMT